MLFLTVPIVTAALQASQQPAADLPNSLMNALASFVASVSEPALVQVLVPLVNAVVTEASAAGGVQGPAGKGKAGLFIMVAVVLRTRPQVRAKVYWAMRLSLRSKTAQPPHLLKASAKLQTASGLCCPRSRHPACRHWEWVTVPLVCTVGVPLC